MVTRRDLTVMAIAIVGTLGVVAAAQDKPAIQGSTVFDWNAMTPTSGGSAAGNVATAFNTRRPGNSNVARDSNVAPAALEPQPIRGADGDEGALARRNGEPITPVLA